MKNTLFFYTLIFFFCSQLTAQDTLPKFVVLKQKDGLSLIKWVNDYGIVKQITIQRSTDSLQRFASIVTMPNAMSKRNEYIDKKSKGTNFYYKIFIQLPEGQYFYTPSYRANMGVTIIMPKPFESTSTYTPNDTMAIAKIKTFIPSEYIFTDKKNNLLLALPNAETKNYKVIFYNENNEPILTIPKVKESNLIMEKYNFGQSGWYYFELYEGTTLIERHKFLINKE